MYEYLRNITSRLLVNENKLTVRESLEIGECPDIFLMDYFFLTYVRHSFVDFMFLVFRSLSKIAFFEGQTEKFEVTHEIQLDFYEWYVSLYPVEQGKSMFFQRKQETMVIKFFGTFAIKDTKLYVTIPDYIMYSFVRLIFYRYLYAIQYTKIDLLLRYMFQNLIEEVFHADFSSKVFFEKNELKESVAKTWCPSKLWTYSKVDELLKNLENSCKKSSNDYNFQKIILNYSENYCNSTLELLFTFYFINFFLYSLVKDTPEFFFDDFYKNYGYWAPDRNLFQQMVQMQTIGVCQNLLGYSLNTENKGDWPFSGTKKDVFFQWYHDYFYNENPYTKNESYLKAIKENYSSLIKVNIGDDSVWAKDDQGKWSPIKRLHFDQLLPIDQNNAEECYLGHIDFLKKFVRKGDVLLSHFSHMFIPARWKQNLPESYDETPFDLALEIFRDRPQKPLVKFHVLTTDLELSQAFLEAVSEDKF